MSYGKVVQVIGPVVDVQFPLSESLPDINNALKVKLEDGTDLIIEVTLELGDGIMRTIAMDSTDGLKRGAEVVDTGRSISVPVGKDTLGRVFNVLGEPIDNGPEFEEDHRRDPIHRDAPSYEELSTGTEILETGIKVIDLLAPYAKGGKIGLFGGAGVGKTVFTKGFAAGLGIKEPVSSPTFTILQVYDEGRLPFYHFDVYRISDPEEMYEIGFEEYIEGEGVCFIEWANLIEELLPAQYTEIHIDKDLSKGFDYRLITVEEVQR